MPQAKPQSVQFAALTFELGAGGAPTEMHLLPVGPFRATDGRPAECAAWQLDAQIAQRVIALAASRKTDTLIDYEHQSLRSRDNGKKVVAAGWVPNTFEWRDGKGLFAIKVAWTADAAQEIQDKQYRYASTVFFYDAETGEVLEIVSIALTNTPALDGLDALADLARKFSTAGGLSPGNLVGEKDMPDEKQLAALTAERDAEKQKVAALTSERDGLKTQLADLTSKNTELTSKVASFEQEKVAAALAAEKAKCTEMIQAALSAGSLVPAEKAYAEKKNLADLTEYLDTKKPLAMLGKQVDGKPAAGGDHGLTEIELAACTRAGLTPEEFAKSKQK